MDQKKRATRQTKGKSKAKQTSAAQKSVKKASAQSADRLPTRYILALVFLLLTVLTVFACFTTDGFFLGWIRDLLHGLGGDPFLWLSPVLFFTLFLIQGFFWREHRVRRSVCAVLSVLHISAITHLLREACQFPGSFAEIGGIYADGVSGVGGGVLGGLLGGAFYAAVGKVCGLIFLFLLCVLCVLCVVDITIRSMIQAIRDRPRPPENTHKSAPKDPAKTVVDHIANKHIVYVEKKKRIADYDIAIDDVPISDTSERPAKRKRNIRTPDQVLEEQLQKPERVTPQVEETPAFDLPPIMGTTAISDLSSSPEEVNPTPQMSFAPEPQPERKDQREETPEATPPQPGTEKVTAEGARASAAEVAEEVQAKAMTPKLEYIFPPLTLLKPSSGTPADGTSELRDNTRRLNEALQSFKIEAKICNVTRGPSVTRYEVELAQGVRLAKITTLQNDLALALGAASVRISAIPEKIAMVGIEVPNKQVTKVALRDVLGSSKFICAKSKSTFAVGKDIGGECIVGDIAQLPHMLIAGTTGSGKSVCMNSLIVSLLYKATPEDVKLIMVDPKMVELGIYNGIPHLLIPVVTDPKKAAGSLQWAVSEMMRRYKLMYDASVRDLEALNRIVESTGEGEKIPQMVVIIDELADLMMVAAKEVEDSIVRIAQMGRASGIHLIIATQRPSADVITGIMKANIPSRIAFSVASAMESRIILDTQGAEKLVGKGDMLYAPAGRGKPHRVQGCFVSDDEVEAVATYVKEHCTADYSQEVLEEIEKKSDKDSRDGRPSEDGRGADSDGDTGDEMLPAAVEVFLETGQASVSMLQRRLKLGYARAARIVDEMEEKGIVGPFVGSKPRAILVTKEQWQTMRNGGVPADADEIPEELPFEDDSIPELIP